MPPLVSLTLATTSSPSHAAATTTTLLPLRLGAFSRPSPRRISAVASVQVKSRAPDLALPENVVSQMEVIKSLEGWAADNMLPFLKPVEYSWQPQDFLPDSSMPDEFREEVQALQERTAELPDDYLVALVGDMITEDALPTYMSMVNMTYGFQPESGADHNPWATWTRRWTAEENRHGDLLHTYLYLTGRVDMTKIQGTIQYLIGAGMKPHGVAGVQKHPYSAPIYTSFQERATAVSHGNTARLAKQHGDPVLARICGVIAADEKRHENAYVGMVGKLLEVDPSGAMVAIGGWMRNKITMPAQLMYDGEDPDIFQHFAAVAQRIGVYTARDYADITEHLVGKWKLEKLEGLTPEGKEEQEFVCGLAAKIRQLQEKVEERAKKRKPHEVKFSWIFNRELSL